jgi:RNA polymerase sigma-70 factor (ECF subfamily)
MTDSALVSSARGGSREAFEALIERYEKRVFRLLRMRSNSVEDAEDLLQDVFLRSWTRLHQFDDRRPFSPWLYTLAVRLAVSRGRKPRLAAATERELDELTSKDNPAEIADRQEQNRNLWVLALTVLGPEPRTVLWLFYAEGLSSLQIGEILGKREEAVRSMLFRARNRLASHLQKATL